MTTEALQPTKVVAFARTCDLCGLSYAHDGSPTWPELRASFFDGQDEHVTGFATEPLKATAGWSAPPAVCIYCLANLLPAKPTDPPPVSSKKPRTSAILTPLPSPAVES